MEYLKKILAKMLFVIGFFVMAIIVLIESNSIEDLKMWYSRFKQRREIEKIPAVRKALEGTAVT